MRHLPLPTALAGIMLLAVLASPRAGIAADDVLRFEVLDRVANPVDRRLFGQFLERASFGEPGPEAFADPETGALPEAIVARLAAMRIPVIRFPAGTDVDYFDWRDMIDEVPGRDGGRPVSERGGNKRITNRFGYPEYFALRDRLGCETIVVANLLDALLAHPDPEAAIIASAGLLAYCNAPVGAELPADMPDWPAVRAAGGHREPFGCEYLQIGNEITFKRNEVAAATGLEDDEELGAWYRRVLRRWIEVARFIDPGIRIFVDADFGRGLERHVLTDEVLRAELAGVSIHRYAPGNCRHLRRRTGEGEPPEVEAGELGVEDWWYACATMPAQLADDGTAVAMRGPPWELAVRLGYRVVSTEWNWNGWGEDVMPAAFRTWLPMARAQGAASYLHGMIRQGGRVDLACQSMLLGHRWNITAVRADPAGKVPPYYFPQGLATTLYNLHHGDRRLAVAQPELPGRPQSYIVGKWTSWEAAVPHLSDVDLVATADDERVFVHVIHRHARAATRIAVDLTGLGIADAAAVHRQLVHRSVDERRSSGNPQPLAPVEAAAAIAGGILELELPPRSLHNLELPRPATD